MPHVAHLVHFQRARTGGDPHCTMTGLPQRVRGTVWQYVGIVPSWWDAGTVGAAFWQLCSPRIYSHFAAAGARSFQVSMAGFQAAVVQWLVSKCSKWKLCIATSSPRSWQMEYCRCPTSIRSIFTWKAIATKKPTPVNWKLRGVLAQTE